LRYLNRQHGYRAVPSMARRELEVATPTWRKTT
jgi:hypothetical protein